MSEKVSICKECDYPTSIITIRVSNDVCYGHGRIVTESGDIEVTDCCGELWYWDYWKYECDESVLREKKCTHENYTEYQDGMVCDDCGAEGDGNE